MPFKKFLDRKIVEQADKLSETDLRHFLLDMFLGETCNLHCKHCYFGDHKPTTNILNYEQWVEIINDFLNSGCRHFHISGKESLLSQHTFAIMEYLNNCKDVYENVYWGIITNGVSLKPNQYNELLQSSIDYLEISLDGYMCSHDFIRGVGVYDKVISVLSQLQNLSKINISYTINNHNAEDFQKVINQLYKIGVKKFYCAPMQNKGSAIHYNIETITLNHYLEVIENIKNYIYSKSSEFQDLKIRFSVPHALVELMLGIEPYSAMILEYFQSGKPINWRFDSNNIELSLHTISIPLFNHVSITSDGSVLLSSDRVAEEHSLGKYDGISAFMKMRKTCIHKYFTTNEKA